MGFESLVGGGSNQVDHRLSHMYDSLLTHADRVANEINKRLDTEEVAVREENNGMIMDQNNHAMESLYGHQADLLDIQCTKIDTLEESGVGYRGGQNASRPQRLVRESEDKRGSGQEGGSEETGSKAKRERERGGLRGREEDGEAGAQWKAWAPLQQSAWHGVGRESIIESVMSALDEDPYFNKLFHGSPIEDESL